MYKRQLLVKLNQRNPEVQAYHFDTIRFWVDQFDIDGIRLDAADVLDFDFMRGLRRLANEIKPEFWLMGEVIHGDYSRWANPEMLHSVTNYELHKGLWSGHNDHNYFETPTPCAVCRACATIPGCICSRTTTMWSAFPCLLYTSDAADD